MKVVAAEKMSMIAKKIFTAAGSSEEEAGIVAQHLVESSLAGVDSHGVIRIPEYISKMQGKPIPRGIFRIIPNAKIATKNDSGVITMLDGGWGFGQVVAKKAMEIAIEKARRFNIGCVTGCNCDHIGRLAWYSLMAVESGMIGITFAKGTATMAPLGGKGKLIGNNPVSYGIPAGEERPIVLDYAMSIAAAGKLTVAIDKGEPVPEGWLIDAEGNPTTDPGAFYKGGSLLPVAAHKGYGMAVVGEVLAGILSGAGVLTDYRGTNSFLNMAINVDAFVPLPEFKSQIDRLIRTVRNAPKIKGVEEIVIPGEPEFKMRETRLRSGIPIADNTWKRITTAGTDVGVPSRIFDESAG